MAASKIRLHLHGDHGQVSYPERANDVSLNHDGLYISQEGDDQEVGTDYWDYHAASAEGIPIEEHEFLNEIYYVLPATSWWDTSGDIEIEDVFVEGSFHEAKILWLITSYSGSYHDIDYVNYAPPLSLPFEKAFDITDNYVESGICITLVVQFLSDDAEITIGSVGAQFDDTPVD